MTLTLFEKFRLRLAQLLARLVVLALPPRFRPEPPLPKLKKKLVNAVTQPLPDLSLETTSRGMKSGPYAMPSSFLDREALSKKEKAAIQNILKKDKRTYEEQCRDADEALRELAKKE